jgi:hypothetical protein
MAQRVTFTSATKPENIVQLPLMMAKWGVSMKRNTLVGKIRRARGESKKMELASLGREVTNLELVSNLYLATRHLSADQMALACECSLISQGKIPHGAEFENRPQLVEDMRFMISLSVHNAVIDALNRLDSQSFIAAGRFIADFKANFADPVRTKILLWKQYFLAARTGPITLEKLKGLIGYRGDISNLRKLAKELRFPVLKKPLGRPKNKPAPNMQATMTRIKIKSLWDALGGTVIEQSGKRREQGCHKK